MKNVYLLTGRGRVAIRMANGAIYHSCLLSSSPGFGPWSNWAWYSVLTSDFCPPPSDWGYPLLQWRVRGQGGESKEKSGHTFLPTHIYTCTCTISRKCGTDKGSLKPFYKRAWKNTHAGSHTHTHTHLLTSGLATTRLPLIFKYCTASIRLWLPFSVIFLPSPGFLSSSSQPFLCSLSILTGVYSFWLSLQSTGHIQFIS